MGKCELCNRSEEGLSLLQANHKEFGRKWVCSDCWSELFKGNRIISGTTSGSSGSLCSGGCSSCPYS